MYKHVNQFAIGLQLLPLLILTSLVCVIGTEPCVTSFNTVGVTYPEGDITIEHGKTIEIYCTLSEAYIRDHGENVIENITFRRNKEKLSKEMIKYVNATTIKLYIEKLPPPETKFYCINEKKDSTICSNSVREAMKPREITDFSCVGYNFVNLTCSWTAPQNYIETNYTLTYRFKYKGNKDYFKCPGIKPTDVASGRTNMHCYWDIQTEPLYRQTQPIYYFKLLAENKFGNRTVNYNFTHYASIIPEAPNGLSVVSRTPSSILLSWNVGLKMRDFQPGLVHRVLYQHVFDNSKWISANTSMLPLKNSTYVFNLTGLPYAYVLYDIRVSARSAKATEDKVWSQFSSITTKTAGKLPGTTPKINMGSFEIKNKVEYRDIIIYWQYIPEQMKNGENFTYRIISVLENMSEKKVNPVEVTSTYALFTNLSMESYIFTITSANEIGLSKNITQIFVPSDRTISSIPEPNVLSIVAHSNFTYELSWVPPMSGNYYEIDNYTLFWCSNDRDRPHNCKGYLEWVEVPPNLKSFNITVPDTQIYQFAVSANSKKGSSGMVWASCTVIPMNGGIGKLNDVWTTTVGPTYIALKWKLECVSGSAGIEGFRLQYCPTQSPPELSCIEDQVKLLNIDDPNAREGNVTFLKPYTTYMLRVFVITKHDTISLQSKNLYTTTTEGSPDTPPQNIQVHNVTSSSITLTWSPPKDFDGKLKDYEIIFSQKKYRNPPIRINPNQTKYVLDNLESYTSYTFVMKACGVSCSNESAPINMTTAVSEPGLMHQPVINNSNEPVIQIYWEPPKRRNGLIDMYELKIIEKTTNGNVPKIFNTKNLEYTIPNCNDQAYKSEYYISVRAINVYDKKKYMGPWSPELEYYCHPVENYVSILLGIILFGLLIILVILYCAYKRLRKKYLSMKDIGITLPGKLSLVAEHEVHEKSPAKEIICMKSSSDVDPISDNQMLLDKKVDCIISRDTSGFCSGQESVLSSLVSGGNLSNNTDSGMEQTDSSNVNDLNKEVPLRLRKPPSHIFNYSHVGVDTNGIQELNVFSGYEPIPKMADFKSPNKCRGYLPFANPPITNILQPSNIGYSTVVPTRNLVNVEVSKPANISYVPNTISKTDLTSFKSEGTSEEDPSNATHYSRFSVDSKILPLTNASNLMFDQQDKESVLQKPSTFINGPSKGYVPHKNFDG